jgi:hypothetical protein
VRIAARDVDAREPVQAGSAIAAGRIGEQDLLMADQSLACLHETSSERVFGVLALESEPVDPRL